MKFLVPVFFLLALHVEAQSIKTDTAFLAEAKKNAIALYTHSMRSQSHLINGSRYIGPELSGGSTYSNKEHPFYSPDWENGTVLYDHEWYNASFLYDISTQKLITDHDSDRIQLISEKIEQFTLGDHSFIKLKEGKLPAGFYEVAYDGPTKVYVSWRKVVESKYKDNQITSEFLPKTTYYIKKNKVFYEVKNKQSVLKVLFERKTELKEFIRSKNQFFSDNRLLFIREMVRFYDLAQNQQLNIE